MARKKKETIVEQENLQTAVLERQAELDNEALQAEFKAMMTPNVLAARAILADQVADLSTVADKVEDYIKRRETALVEVHRLNLLVKGREMLLKELASISPEYGRTKAKVEALQALCSQTYYVGTAKVLCLPENHSTRQLLKELEQRLSHAETLAVGDLNVQIASQTQLCKDLGAFDLVAAERRQEG